jgi:uncharacterized protein (TIGR04551 family)
MSRLHVLAASAALLLASGARAQAPAMEAAPVDPKVEALVKAAVEKAKQELRDEVRAELQGAQSTAAFMGAAAEGPKLQFFELNGYLRVRADLLDNLPLRRGLDSNGQYLFPGLVYGTRNSGTQTSSNMRLRLTPTINASEHVRVRAELDLFDNYVLGASGGAVVGTPAQVDRPLSNLKRAWGEVETPVGLISAGRMPTSFGLGIVSSDAGGLDDDYGDTHDRLQFATLPLATPLGPLSLVPFLDFDADGPIQVDQRFGAGAGQPFSRDSAFNGRTLGLKLLKLDTDDELRRKLERGETSTNYGAMYTYSTLGKVVNPYWDPNEPPPGTGVATDNLRAEYYARAEYRHQLSLWFRHQSKRLTVEAEVTGLTGQIGDPGPYSASLDYTGGQLQLRQSGGALRASYQVAPNKVTLGGEVGYASGDPAPGFGNRPGQLAAPIDPGGSATLPTPGAFEGPQYGPGDRVVRNFRFNPGYRVDLILWREIIGQVTDAWYVKPTLRWNIFSGLAFDAQLVYSQALYGSTTPSSISASGGAKPLGVEADTKLTYATDDGFVTWVSYGVLFPMAGFDGAGSLSRAHALRAGLALRF